MRLPAASCLLLGLLLCVLPGGCIVPYATPPLQAEVGAVSTTTPTAGATSEHRAPGPAVHVAAGAHLASGLQRTPLDVGAGWVFERADNSSRHGGYLGTSWFFERSGGARTAIGVRGELLTGISGRKLAAKLRIDHELMRRVSSPFKGDSRCGVSAGRFHGTAAIGVFAEAGRTWLPDGQTAFVATTGISVRVPSSVAVWIGIPFPGC